MTTRYEVTATHDDGRTILVGFTPRRSRIGLLCLLGTAVNRSPELRRIFQDDGWEFKPKPQIGIAHGPWYIGFTGRTERQWACDA